jgi:hypothetical protein
MCKIKPHMQELRWIQGIGGDDTLHNAVSIAFYTKVYVYYGMKPN